MFVELIQKQPTAFVDGQFYICAINSCICLPSYFHSMKKKQKFVARKGKTTRDAYKKAKKHQQELLDQQEQRKSLFLSRHHIIL